ncbi:MAG: 50S ribosomal protein L23 [Ignavibacteria bacterium]|nr:50S ribosomal protein L23 [Ignavibacteria bacterium]
MKSVLIRPLITEKNTTAQETLNKYAFEVNKNSNKIEIARAVEKKFNVRVIGVNTITSKGKRKSQMTKKGRFEGYRADRKKAIVTLHKEDKIDFLGTVE